MANVVDYEKSEKWADVVPIPLDEGGPHPLAAIAYTAEYSQAMSYLRAIMAADEASERALDLTDHIIRINPAHYTVWLYRASILKRLQADPLEELSWMNAIAIKHVKNYQIWQHRQVIMSQLTTLPENEMTFLTRMLAKDAKNYHVWSYRHWLVRHFSMWPPTALPGDEHAESKELKLMDDLLEDDVRNNSAWSHRFFVIFGRDQVEPPYKFYANTISDAIWDREIQYAKDKIALAPQNPSPWNYLEGVQRKRGRDMAELENFAVKYAPTEQPDEIKSSHALHILAEIWGKAGKTEKARTALDLLATKLDPIRANYWKWRGRSLGLESTPAETAVSS